MVDKAKIEEAVKLLLEGIGEDVNREGLVETPQRIARMYEEIFARRPQLQEKLTAQVADALMDYLKPKGVMILIEAEHMCMTMRGVKKPGSKTVTVATRGAFEENAALQETFYHMLER